MAKITASQIINLALNEVNTKEGYKNRTKYGKAYGMDGEPWCMIFIWWLFKQLNASELFYNGKKIAGCTAFMNWCKANGKWITSNYKAGDIVLYDFDKSGDADHVGIIVEVKKDKIVTVEGNTSCDDKGSQSNGDGVYRKERGYSKIKGAFRPNYITTIGYEAHCQSIGWQGWKYNGDTAGTTGKAKRLEAIKIKCDGINVKYRAHIQSYGWQNWKSNGEIAGTVGAAKRLEAIVIDADVPIRYRVHVQGIGWQPWRYNGEVAGTVGEAKRVEAIEIKIN